jgi:hypothetical protein
VARTSIQGATGVKARLHVPIHQNVADSPLGRFAAEALAAPLDAAVERLQQGLAALPDDPGDPAFVMVNLWILAEDLPPSNIRHQRRLRQLSVEVGVARRRLGSTPRAADVEVLIAAAECTLQAAVGRLVGARGTPPPRRKASAKTACPP